MNIQDELISENDSQIVPHSQNILVRPPIPSQNQSKILEKEFQSNSKEGHSLFKLHLPPPSHDQEDKQSIERARQRKGRKGKVNIENTQRSSVKKIEKLKLKPEQQNIKIIDLENHEELIVQNTKGIQKTEQIADLRINAYVSALKEEDEDEIGNSFLKVNYGCKKDRLIVQPSIVNNQDEKYHTKADDMNGKKEEKIQRVPSKLKQGLFYENQDNEFDFAKIDSKKSLETGTLTTSRDDLSSRQILEIHSQEKRGRIKLRPIKQTLKNQSQTLYALYQKPQDNEANKEQKRRILSNGKFQILKEDIHDILGFVTRSISEDQCVQTTITRNRGCTKLCYLDYDLQTNDGKYLISCKKMPWHLASTYHISLVNNSFDRNSEYLIGKIIGNFTGTLFNIFTIQSQDISAMQLDSTIYYKPSCISCQAKTRQIEIYIKDKTIKFQDIQGFEEGKNLKQLIEVGRNLEDKKIYKFISKPPKWNPDKKVYTINLRKKAKFTSVKNMVIVRQDDFNEQGILIAKKQQNQFELDISHPFSPAIALGVAMTSFDFKIASQ